jgi:hypothetical protein
MPTASTLISWCRSRRRAVDDTSHNHWGTKVALALQRRWRRVKDWYTESYPTCDTGEYEPSWVLARRANLANCGFYRLPDELMLQIMGNLDDVSKAIALRTCGLFMRIMSDQPLCCQLLGSFYATGIQVSSPFEQRALRTGLEAGHETLALRKQVDRLLDRDRFCDPCRQFREDGRYEKAMQALQGTLWCSHCDKVHKRPLFSAHQRDASSATRICVLAEGKAQFCAHRSIGWDSAHNVVCRTEFCRHPDHDPPWYTCWKNYLTRHLTLGYERPRISFYHPLNCYRAPMSSTTLFLFHLHRGVPITRAWLQERLTAKAHVLDKMLCPHVTSRDGQLLLPFGPDCCACFDCPRWIGHSCSTDDRPYQDRSYRCCRCNTAKTSGRAGYFIPREYNFRHRYTCYICSASYTWRRDGSAGSAVYLEMRTLTASATLSLPVRPRFSLRYTFSCWLYNLHPESWGILDDEELHHVAWCDDINCMSRWRWESLLRLLEDT